LPLTTSKIAHIQARLRKVMQGRTQLVDLTLQSTPTTQTTLTVPAVWRVQEDQDPIFDPAGTGGDDAKIADVIALFNIQDVTFAQMRSCVYAQLHPGQPGPPIATRFLPTSIEVKGLMPGGDRILVTFDRQR
jgi:hypothetical protein